MAIIATVYRACNKCQKCCEVFTCVHTISFKPINIQWDKYYFPNFACEKTKA